MSENDYREYLISCGFNEKEIDQKLKDREIMQKLYYEKDQEQREITCQSYENSIKKMTKRVEVFLGVKE